MGFIFFWEVQKFSWRDMFENLREENIDDIFNNDLL